VYACADPARHPRPGRKLLKAMRYRVPLTLSFRRVSELSSHATPPRVLLAAIGLLALSLRLYGLGDKPFWMDEITSLHRATATVPHLIADSLHQNHYPTYFLLLWLVARVGASQWLLRLPSAVFGAVAASLVCAIGGRAAGPRSGAIAGLLMAFSPFEVQLGQEARSYTLVCCLILTALFGFVRLAQLPALAALPLVRNGAARGAWLAYCLGTAAALVVLNVAVPWLVASNLGALTIAWRAGTARRGFLRNWGIAQLFILAIWLPLFIAVYIGSEGGVLDGAGWAPSGTVETIWGIVAPVYLLRISSFITLDLAPAAVPALSLGIVALVAIGIWRLRHQPTVLAAVGLAAFLLPLGMLLLSLRVPVLVPRYFAWGAGPFFILAGAGLGQLPTGRLAALAGMLGAACFVNLVPYYDYETKPRWDQLAARLATKIQPGDVVFVNNYYSYYVFSVFAAGANFADRVKLTWVDQNELGRKTLVDHALAEKARQAAGHNLWAVYGRAGQAAMQSLDSYRRSLAVLGRPAAEFSIGRYIVAWRYPEPEETDPNAQTTTPQACSDPCGTDQPHP
jgi:mannosyltransferase